MKIMDFYEWSWISMSLKLFKKDSFSNDWSFYFDVILHLYID